MWLKDTETGEVKTKQSWIKILNKEAKESFADEPYDGRELLRALMEDGKMVQVIMIGGR